MRHGVLLSRRQTPFLVVRDVVDVHVVRGEAAPRRNVKVANNLVDTDNAFKSASFAALRVNSLGVVLALALLNVGPLAESPLFLGVRFAHFVAGAAAPGLDGVGRWGRAAAFAAVVWVEVLGFFGVAWDLLAGFYGRVMEWKLPRLQLQCLDVKDAAALRSRRKADLVHTVRDADLLLA